MKSFISKVVNAIIAEHTNFSNLTIVLPSQRACVFLKDEFIKKVNKTSFLPQIISIENYIQILADIKLIDTTQLLFEFYAIYKQSMSQEKTDSFDTFSQWATIALHDFNEIDSYLVDQHKLFSNLKDIEKLKRWFQNENPSELSKKHLSFFSDLELLYNNLYHRLKENKYGYQGLIYREATNNLEFYIDSNLDKKVVFVGFNALNKAEEYIIQELLNNNIATIYWDAHKSFMEPANEAGTFFRKYKNEWTYYNNNPFLWENDFDLNNKDIQIIGAPKNITQIKYAGELLAKTVNFSKTAFVLADENLLSIVLSSLPKTVGEINITMGYPLCDMPIASLFEKLFQLHINQEKFNKSVSQQFYYKDILNIISEPYLHKLAYKELQKINAHIKSENRIFLTVEDLTKPLSSQEEEKVSLLFSIFGFFDDVDKLIDKCIALILALKQTVSGIEKEQLFRFYKVFKQLEVLNLKYKHIKDIKTLLLFYRQVLKNEKLSFQGEPLQGLQLMGMLETRVLDFETLIITSVNEGILPGGKKEFSFIPFDVKKHFELPTYQEKDAIFSYHFQRLLLRAKKTYLLYNTETDGYGSGEKSRFLTRLEMENPSIIKTVVAPKLQKTDLPDLSVEKTPEVLKRLEELFTKGISPSALSSYLYDPIEFYERKILKISEVDDVEETVATNTMGTVIHSVLEEMYKPFVGKFVQEEDIKHMLEKIEELLVRAFEKYYKKGDVSTGKNKLIVEVSKDYIKKFLNQELEAVKQNKQLKIIALEEPLTAQIQVEGVDYPITIRGFVDRIDELDGETRIIDYKTGKVEARNLKINDFSVIPTDYKYAKAMQVMLYSFLYTSNLKKHPKMLQAGIVSFKNLKSGFLKMNFSEKPSTVDCIITEERINNFMDEMKLFILDILNPKQPFIQNKNKPF
ncbi:PD-(D/E)XK nuclease family protein [Lutibacter sp.]